MQSVVPVFPIGCCFGFFGFPSIDLATGWAAEVVMVACKRDRPRRCDFVRLDATGSTTLEHIRTRRALPWMLQFRRERSLAGLPSLAFVEGLAFMLRLCKPLAVHGRSGGSLCNKDWIRSHEDQRDKGYNVGCIVLFLSCRLPPRLS